MKGHEQPIDVEGCITDLHTLKLNPSTIRIDGEKAKSLPTPSITIEDLPNEILALILEAGSILPSIPKGRHSDNTPRTQSLTFPTLVSSLSMRLRSLALGTPNIWSTILISATGVIPIELSTLYLKRSYLSLLDLSIDLSCSGGGIHPDILTSIVSLVTPHLHRSKKLFVAADSRKTMEAFIMHFRNTPFGNLKESHFRVIMNSCADWMGYRDEVDFISIPQGLTSLRLRGVPSPSFGRLFRLTKLDLNDVVISFSQFKDLLPPSLERLILRTAVYINPFPASSSSSDTTADHIIHLPNLQSLTLDVGDWHSEGCQELLSIIYMPSLSHLEMSLLNLRGLDRLLHASRTLYASRTWNVRTLVLCNTTISLQDGFKDLCSIFPLVEELLLLGPNEENPIPPSLLTPEGNPPWPHLHSITLSNPSLDWLVQVSEALAGAGRRLKLVRSPLVMEEYCGSKEEYVDRVSRLGKCVDVLEIGDEYHAGEYFTGPDDWGGPLRP